MQSRGITAENFSCFLDQLTKVCASASERKAEILHEKLEKALKYLHDSFTKVWLELCVSSMIRILESHPERCTDYLASVLTPNAADNFIPSFCSSLKSRLLAQGTGSIYYSFVQLLDCYERKLLGTGKKELYSEFHRLSITAEELFCLPSPVIESFLLGTKEQDHLKPRGYLDKLPWDAISIFAEEGEEDMLYELLCQLESDSDGIVSLHVMDKLLLGFCVAEFSETFSRALHRMYHENNMLWLNLEQIIHLPCIIERVAYQSLSSDSFQCIRQYLMQVHSALLNDSSFTMEKAIEHISSDISISSLDSFPLDWKVLEAVSLETLHIIAYYCHELIMKTENTTLLFRLSITYSNLLLLMESVSNSEQVYNLLIGDICENAVLNRLSTASFFRILVPIVLSKMCCTELWKHSLVYSCIQLFSNTSDNQ